MDELQLYKDQTYSEPVTLIMSEKRMEVGTVLEKIYYMKNESSEWAIENITFTKNDEDLVIEHPNMIPPNSAVPVKVTFSPPVERRKPLKQPVIIDGDLMIG